jgi:voltage-gated potassium channel Kch
MAAPHEWRGSWRKESQSFVGKQLHVGTWASTLSWRALATFPAVVTLETIGFSETVIREPLAADFGAVLAAAPSLRRVTGVPTSDQRRGRDGLATRLEAVAKANGFRREPESAQTAAFAREG